MTVHCKNSKKVFYAILHVLVMVSSTACAYDKQATLAWATNIQPWATHHLRQWFGLLLLLLITYSIFYNP